jgi:triphosphoribosyl-dephospho-CoA synthase
MSSVVPAIRFLLERSLSELDCLRPESAWTLGTCTAAACLLEAAAPKAGNVYPGAAFHDMSYEDFRRSARIFGEAVDRHPQLPMGALVRVSIQDTRVEVEANTNLGIVLLLAPLIVAARRRPWVLPSLASVEAPSVLAQELHAELRVILRQLTAADAEQVYQAIRLSRAGGLGDSPAMDVRHPAPADLLDAMRLASHRDDIAKAYVEDYREIFEMATRLRQLYGAESCGWFTAIRRLQLERLASDGDSLIARKNTPREVAAAQRLARAVLGVPAAEAQRWLDAWTELDSYLRGDGNRRNPGTTADMIAAAIWIVLWSEGRLLENSVAESGANDESL